MKKSTSSYSTIICNHLDWGVDDDEGHMLFGKESSLHKVRESHSLTFTNWEGVSSLSVPKVSQVFDHHDGWTFAHHKLRSFSIQFPISTRLFTIPLLCSYLFNLMCFEREFIRIWNKCRLIFYRLKQVLVMY